MHTYGKGVHHIQAINEHVSTRSDRRTNQSIDLLSNYQEDLTGKVGLIWISLENLEIILRWRLAKLSLETLHL